jgi:hypothetical protein
MSFRASEGAQWSDKGAAIKKVRAYVVEHADTSLIFDTTGPADRTLYSDEEGAVRPAGDAVTISLSGDGQILFDATGTAAFLVESSGAWVVDTTGPAAAFFVTDEEGALRIWTQDVGVVKIEDRAVFYATT